MTIQVELRGSRLIVAIETYLVTVQINYRGVGEGGEVGQEGK